MFSPDIEVFESNHASPPESAGVVYVVDDDVSVRESLELLLLSAGYRVESFASAEGFLACECASVPRCLILDVRLPELSGLELQARIAVAGPVALAPIIFITGRGDIPMTVQAMKAGAIEFLTKPFDHERLLDAVAEALKCSRAALVMANENDCLRRRYASLTTRERDVMRLVVRGLLNKQVGGELGISEITVKSHRGKMMRKMQADSLPDLVVMAAKLRGWAART